ncbi:WD domain, G-beta repeat-containing protein [Toxoplasma gondii MAS]|uniref:WD domain, G-beta repeat-containing protein n=1 Tax=Toxoplasma gondii MAS TaxID=943118 RepID=A0A086Q0L5_TOXGO|nr:WD domain, G-beta repeat-containing protein [Toxoplasma gondii MAS]
MAEEFFPASSSASSQRGGGRRETGRQSSSSPSRSLLSRSSVRLSTSRRDMLLLSSSLPSSARVAGEPAPQSRDAGPGQRGSREEAQANIPTREKNDSAEDRRSAGVLRWLRQFAPLRRRLSATRTVLPRLTVLPDGHDRSVLSVDVHPCGDFAVSGSADHGLRLFSLPPRLAPGLVGELFRAREGHADWVTCCAFAPDGSVVSGAMDGKLFLWNTKNHLLRRSSHATRTSRNLLPSPGSATHWAAAAAAPPLARERGERGRSQEGEASRGRERLSAQTQTCRASTNRISGREFRGGHLASISGLQIAPVTSSQPAASSLSDAASSRGTQEFSRQTSGSEPPAFCMTSGYDGFLRLWNLQTLREMVALSRVAEGSPLAPSPLVRFVWANAFACAGSKAGDLTVWDVNAGRRVCSSRGGLHAAGVACLRLWASFCGVETVPLLASGSVRDGQLALWDLRAFSSPVASLQAHAGSLNEILCLSDSGGALGNSDRRMATERVLCTMGADGACRFWDLRRLSSGGQAATRERTDTGSANGALLREVCLGGPARGFLCGDVVHSGFVCGGAGDGSVYLMSAGDGDADSEFGCHFAEANELPGVCWRLQSDRKGAVQVLRAVVTPANAAEGASDQFEEDRGSQASKQEIVRGVIAGGDDGHLSFIEFD